MSRRGTKLPDMMRLEAMPENRTQIPRPATGAAIDVDAAAIAAVIPEAVTVVIEVTRAIATLHHAVELRAN